MDTYSLRLFIILVSNLFHNSIPKPIYISLIPIMYPSLRSIPYKKLIMKKWKDLDKNSKSHMLNWVDYNRMLTLKYLPEDPHKYNY